jgi:hypothetical protein
MTESKKNKNALFGTKPVYQTPTEAAAQALQGNLANLPAAELLGSQVNTFNQQQQLDALRRAIPNFDQIVAKQSGILQSQLAGEIPKDVQDRLQSYDAAKALSGGYAGSSVHGALNARDFGMTSLDITNKALDSASRWTTNMAQLTQPALFNVGSAFISPEQQYAHNKLVADVKAAPDPGVRGSFDSRMALFGELLGVYGGAGYQGAYRGTTRGPAAPTTTPQYLAPQNWGNAGVGASEGGGNIGQFNTVGASAVSSPGYGSGGPFE